MKKISIYSFIISFTLLTTSIFAASTFTDIIPTSWYNESITYAYENSLMNGTSDTEFSPDGTTTRGMIVTILYRLAGSPTVAGENGFSDVPKTEYYNTPVTWAVQNNIVSGYGDGVFAPNDNITREQLAAIIYRYLSYIGFDVTSTADLSAYEDFASVSDYAKTALSWAVDAELIKGMTEDTLVPQGNATRAQAATIFMRLDMMIKASDKSDESDKEDAEKNDAEKNEEEVEAKDKTDDRDEINNSTDTDGGGSKPSKPSKPPKPQDKPENVPDDSNDNMSDTGTWDKLD